MPSRVQIAKQDIVKLFDESAQRVYSHGDIASILQENRNYWRLAQRMTTDDFVEFLLDKTNLSKVTFDSDKQPPITRYAWGQVSSFQLALSLKPKSYLTHGTAAFLHGLNDLLPKMIYINHEQSMKPASKDAISSEAIARAFSKPQRESGAVYAYENIRVTIVNGKHTNGLEVGEFPGPEGELLAITKLERTLIDMAVRPNYSGGIYQVLDAYKTAKEKVSLNALVSILKKLQYAYPYHQAIGFYMERAGYESNRLALLKRIGMSVDFYLVHGMTETEYSAEWRLFFPKGF